jgi:hypothetical protein
VHHREIYKPQIQLWLPVYIGNLTLAKSKNRRASYRRLSARRAAWLCFFNTRKGVNVAVELKAGKSREIQYQFQQGEVIKSTFARMRMASRSPRLRRASYAARLLNIPGLYFSGLWFKSTARELFVSLVRVGDELKAGGFYTRALVVKALKGELKRRKEAHLIILARKRELANTVEGENSPHRRLRTSRASKEQ